MAVDPSLVQCLPVVLLLAIIVGVVLDETTACSRLRNNQVSHLEAKWNNYLVFDQLQVMPAKWWIVTQLE